jgi:hypothetical protein
MSLSLASSLEGKLAGIADDRVLVIDAYRSWHCGTWIGDLTVEWWRQRPGDNFVAIAELEGVPVLVHQRLVRILDAAGATLVRSRLPFFGAVHLELARPELWLDYLDRPIAWRPTPALEPGGSR